MFSQTTAVCHAHSSSYLTTVCVIGQEVRSVKMTFALSFPLPPTLSVSFSLCYCSLSSLSFTHELSSLSFTFSLSPSLCLAFTLPLPPLSLSLSLLSISLLSEQRARSGAAWRSSLGPAPALLSLMTSWLCRQVWMFCQHSSVFMITRRCVQEHTVPKPEINGT